MAAWPFQFRHIFNSAYPIVNWPAGFGLRKAAWGWGRVVGTVGRVKGIGG